MNEAQGILARDPKIKLHVPKKSLPKMSVSGVNIPDEEIIDSILSKNTRIRSLVNSGKHFELLFVQKIKARNNIEYRNAILKMDPEIRNLIRENNHKVFVGLKNCMVHDRIYYKTCFNCQEIGSHTSDTCTKSTPTCRYCSESHKSADCVNKNNSEKYNCSNCLRSNNDQYVSKAKTHMTNSNICPVVIDLTQKIVENTKYETDPKNA